MRRLLATSVVLLVACGPAPSPEPIVPSGPILETVAGTGEAAWDGDGRPATDSGLYAPLKTVIGPSGRVLILDWNNHRVRELGDDGALTTVLGTGIEEGGDNGAPATSFSIHHPFDLERTAAGELYFAGYHDPRLLKVDREGRVRVVAGAGVNGNFGDGGPARVAMLEAPAGVATAPDGACWIADQLNHNIRRVDSSGLIHAFAGTSTRGYSGDGGPATEARLNGPTRIELDPKSGALFVADSGNHVIRRIDPRGVITTIAGTGEPGFAGDGGPAASAQLNWPFDLVLEDDGSIVIADSENHRVRRIDPRGVITTIAGTGAPGSGGDGGPPERAELRSPRGVMLDGEGRLWIADTLNHRIRRVSAPLW